MAEKNWKVSLNLEGVAPADLFVNIDEGAYHAKTVGSTQKDNGNILVDVVITEPGDSEGLPSQLTLGTDWSKEYNAKKFKAAMISMGAKEEALSGPIEVEAKHINGKDCLLYFGRNPEEGELDEKGKKMHQQREFISLERYEQIKGAKVSVRGRAKAKAAAATPEGNGAKGVSEGDFVVQPAGTGPLASRLGGNKGAASPFGN